eukprot:366450-Chlamydomonas_euryale.AAC.23
MPRLRPRLLHNLDKGRRCRRLGPERAVHHAARDGRPGLRHVTPGRRRAGGHRRRRRHARAAVAVQLAVACRRCRL